jgi:hypothetical protein
MNLKRFFGILLIFGAAAGFVFSVIGIVEVWRYRPIVTHSVVNTLDLMDQTLNTTQDSLTIVGQVVQVTSADVTSLKTTTKMLAKSIHDINPMLDSLTKLTSVDFPATVDATQTSLTSAQSSALLIDNVLATLTSIPFLPVAPYQPSVPLHTSLAQISTSLDSLTPALSTITTSLAEGKTSMGVIEVELNKISDTTIEISNALISAQSIVDQYKTVVAQFKVRVELMQRLATGWLTTTAWILTFVLSWFLFIQLGMCAQGLEMLHRHKKIQTVMGILPAEKVSIPTGL